ncbi:MAG: hypothetical protein KUL86_03215 [Castellaniella sp.]|nr:hypothetical protein [Castellaniella sp.]
MKRVILSTQPWQIQATESVWSIIRRYLELDRPTTRQASDICGRPITGGPMEHWQLYRGDAGVSQYAIFQKSFGLTRRQMSEATLLLPRGAQGRQGEVRFCKQCLLMGFHSAIYQIPWMSECPIHGLPLQRECWNCGYPVNAHWSGIHSGDAYKCRKCHVYLGDPFGTARHPLTTADRRLLRNVHSKYLRELETICRVYFPATSNGYRFSELGYILHSEKMNSSKEKYLQPLEKTYSAKCEIRRHSKKLAQTAHEEGSSLRYERLEKLLKSIYKSFRRNYEKRMDVRQHRSMNHIKSGYSHGDMMEIERHNRDSTFIVWCLLWRMMENIHKRFPLSYDYRLTGQIFGGNVQRPLWEPQFLGRFFGSIGPAWYSEQGAVASWHASDGSRLCEPDLWSTCHAFTAYLLSLFSEMELLADAVIRLSFVEALRDDFQYEHLGIKIAATVVHGNTLYFSAWQPVDRISEGRLTWGRFALRSRERRILMHAEAEAFAMFARGGSTPSNQGL